MSASGSTSGRIMSNVCSSTLVQLKPLKKGCRRIFWIPSAPTPMRSPSLCFSNRLTRSAASSSNWRGNERMRPAVMRRYRSLWVCPWNGGYPVIISKSSTPMAQKSAARLHPCCRSVSGAR